MFKLKAHGKIRVADYPRLVVEVAHHQQGYGAPVVLECQLPHHLKEAGLELVEGDAIWLEGNAYQARDDADRPSLRVNVSMMTTPQPSLINGRGSLYATVHGRIHTEVESGTVEKGKREGCEYVRFDLRVHVPEMPRMHNVVLRVKGWDGESSWIAHKHSKGDRISLEGNLFEVRFKDATGVDRCAHQLAVADWWWGKDRCDGATVVSERVTTRPVQGAPVVIRRSR